MDTDQKALNYNRRFNAEQVHKKPSSDTIKFMEKINVELCYIKKEINEMKDTLHEFIDKCDNRYVSKDRFSPVEKIAYGLISLIGAGFIGGLIYLLIYQ